MSLERERLREPGSSTGLDSGAWVTGARGRARGSTFSEERKVGVRLVRGQTLSKTYPIHPEPAPTQTVTSKLSLRAFAPLLLLGRKELRYKRKYIYSHLHLWDRIFVEEFPVERNSFCVL